MPESPDATSNPGVISRQLGCVPPYVALLVALAIVVFTVIPSLMQVRSGRYRPSCQNNLKQLGLVFKMYANENGPAERYPALSAIPGRLMFEALDITEAVTGRAVYPEYLQDTLIMYCVHDLHRGKPAQMLQRAPEIAFDDHSYFYLGYAVTDEESITSFATAYRAALGKPDPFADDLSVAPGTGTFGTDTLYRLSDSLAGDLHEQGVVIPGTQPGAGIAPDSVLASRIPVIIERIVNHIPIGGNVLYLDGHVEYHRFPGEWPMTEATMRTLLELDALGVVGADS